MKVVKKCDGRSEHNVLDESTDYYLCGERQGMHPYLLAKKDYEPVEEWKDVTGMYGGIQVTVPGLEERQYRLVNSTGGYRLEERKRA